MSSRGKLLESDQAKVTSAVSVAENFTKLYYEFVDKMRHKLSKLYHAEGMLVWNGNQVCGGESIQRFYEDLPTSHHSIVSLDSQPVGESAVSDQTTVLITTSGFVTFHSRKHSFQQTFVITVQDDKWKVVSDCFRFQS